MSLYDIDDPVRLKKIRKRTDELTSALRRLEEINVELARQKDISERANRSKTQFLAAASHDILQPLNAAQLTISSLYDLQQSDKARAMVAQVERSLDTMNELLRTLLDISRLDAGVTLPRFTSVPIPPILDSLLSDLRPMAEKKGLRLRVAVTNDCVYTDRLMLRRALQNLISNAIHYTDKGGVLIGTRRQGDRISIEVIDTGLGIPEDQQEKIFEEFHRGPLAEGAADQGTGLGLGLAIVNRLVTALNHEVSVQSSPGKGSVFRISALRALSPPALQNPETQQSALPAAKGNLSSRRILVLENDPAVVEAMEGLLANWGCEFKVGRSTRDALEALESLRWIPDLIIADHHLDHGNLGTETLAQLFTILPTKVPAILATADVSETVVEEAKRLGVEHMPKPVKPAQLRALATHMINGGE